MDLTTLSDEQLRALHTQSKLRAMSDDELRALAKPAAQAPQAKPASGNSQAWRAMIPPQMGGPLVPDLVMGGRQAWDAAAQMAARGAEGVADKFGGSKMLTGMREDTEAANKEALADYTQRFDPDKGLPQSIARGVGQALVTGPFTPAIKAGGIIKSAATGAGIGAGAGVLTPVYDIPEGGSFLNEKGKQAGAGALFGGGAAGAVGLAAKAVSPKLAEGAKRLLDRDIRLTPGQALGGVTKGIEDRVAGLPILGDVVNNARRNAVDDFNRSIYARALESFGDDGLQVAKSAKVGGDGIKAVGDYLGKQYDAALAKSVPSVVDDSFRAVMQKLNSMVPQSLRGEFAGIVNRNIVVTPGNTVTPSVARSAESEIGRLAAQYRGSAVGAERELGLALGQAQTELRQLIARHNPESAPMIEAANKGWRTLVQMEKAASSVGAKDGVFTPAHFLAAVKATDRTLRHRGFVRNDAWNAKLARDAKRVLPNDVPDSGTVGRAATIAAIAKPEVLAGLLIGSAPYLPGSSALVRGAITKRPEWAAPLSDELKRLAPYSGLLGGLSLEQ